MTIIGASMTITGQITSQEDVTIHGKVTGKIAMQSGSLLVSPGANVEAEADVTRIGINGRFVGDVSAAERIELTSTADVTGTLVAPSVVLNDGAVFNGMIDITGGKQAGAVTPRVLHAKAS